MRNYVVVLINKYHHDSGNVLHSIKRKIGRMLVPIAVILRKLLRKLLRELLLNWIVLLLMIM